MRTSLNLESYIHRCVNCLCMLAYIMGELEIYNKKNKYVKKKKRFNRAK